MTDTDSKVPDIPALWYDTDYIYGTPAELYLYGRLGEFEIAHIPTYSLRWLSAENCPNWKGSNRSICPAGAAGLLVAGYYPTCDRFLHSGSYISTPVAVELEALRDCGRRIKDRWRRTFGSPKGCAVEVWCEDGGERGRVLLSEGVITALACALLYGSGSGYDQSLAAGSASNLAALSLPKGRDYVLVADGDETGRKNAAVLSHKLNYSLEVIYNEKGKDAADVIRRTKS